QRDAARAAAAGRLARDPEDRGVRLPDRRHRLLPRPGGLRRHRGRGPGCDARRGRVDLPRARCRCDPGARHPVADRRPLKPSRTAASIIGGPVSPLRRRYAMHTTCCWPRLLTGVGLLLSLMALSADADPPSNGNLGKRIEDFTLTDTTGKTWSLAGL